MQLQSDFYDYYDHLFTEEGPVLERPGDGVTRVPDNNYYGPLDPRQILVGVGGTIHYGVYYDGRFLWGKELEAHGTVVLAPHTVGEFRVAIPCRGQRRLFRCDPSAYPPGLAPQAALEWAYATVDYLDRVPRLYPNPRLQSLDFHKYMSAEDVYQNLQYYVTRTLAAR